MPVDAAFWKGEHRLVMPNRKMENTPAVYCGEHNIIYSFMESWSSSLSDLNVRLFMDDYNGQSRQSLVWKEETQALFHGVLVGPALFPWHGPGREKPKQYSTMTSSLPGPISLCCPVLSSRFLESPLSD